MLERPDLLGQIALGEGLLDAAALTDCLDFQTRRAETGERMLLGQILVARRHVDSAALDRLLTKQQEMRATSSSRTVLLSVADEAAPPRAVPPAAGEKARLGPFSLQKRLGKGGMGTVYLARKDGEERLCALKVLDPAPGGAPEEIVRRFRREAEFMLALDHPHIVKAYEVGTIDRRHYFSMEYVPGGDLMEFLARHGRIEPLAALRLMRQVADALHYGARIGVVHRDLKPENILLAGDGTCKLADMGLAILARREDLRLTAPGTTLGTPSYMSPEQAMAERDIDTRSDVYSLGCTFYHAVCGRPPYQGENAVVIAQKHMKEAPPRPAGLVPGLEDSVEKILLKCIEKDRSTRYQSSGELVEAIDLVLAASAGAPPSSAEAAQGGAVRSSTERRRSPSAAAAQAGAGPARSPGASPRRRETGVEEQFSFSMGSAKTGPMRGVGPRRFASGPGGRPKTSRDGGATGGRAGPGAAPSSRGGRPPACACRRTHADRSSAGPAEAALRGPGERGRKAAPASSRAAAQSGISARPGARGVPRPAEDGRTRRAGRTGALIAAAALALLGIAALVVWLAVL
jgi:serine/threonine protein kinase